MMAASRHHSLALASAVALWAGWGEILHADQPSPDSASGTAAYGQHCARCHGVAGRGDGLDAKRFYPRPRDLTLGVYKFRSTASGSPPSDDDLFRTITSGLPGTNMPDWQHLDEPTRWQLVAYLKSLSPVFQESTPAPVAIAEDPGSERADLAKGKALYEQLACAACHGGSGRANGPSAAGLVDDWGRPIRPANLTQGWNYRGGHDARSVMLRVLTGIDGAGMPSYAEAVSPQDAWHLAYYVTSLQESPHWNPITAVVALQGPLPDSPDDPRWTMAERTDVRLRNMASASGEWEAPPTVNLASIQAIHNEREIAFRVSWADPTQDSQAPPDAFALVLKPAGARGDVVTLQAWPYAGSPALDVCYWSAQTGTAFERLAEDVDRFRAAPSPPPSLASAARYEDGRWHLVLVRPLRPELPEGAAEVAVDGLTSIACVVWDGGNPEAQAVSPWIDVALHGAQH